jgi:hypothetical protein
MESYRFAHGFNKKLGDKNFWWKTGSYYNFHNRLLFGGEPVKDIFS